MTTPRSSEKGVSLIALMAALTITLIAMTVVMPSWDYVMQNEREEELLFRGSQIALAIQEYQKKNANALPPTLEVLVKGRPRFLRRLYKDPMTPKGEWRLLRGFETCPTPKTSERGVVPQAAPIGTMGHGGTGGGGIAGVVSRSTKKSLRIVWEQQQYDGWCFTADKPYPPAIGKQPRVAGSTGITPTPTPFSRR